MESTTVHTTAQTTGWSVRMLHYLDAAGLVSPPRSPSGYRLYGPQEIGHLRRLRQLLADHDLRPADLQVALRLRSEPALAHAVDDWLAATTAVVAPDLSQQDPRREASAEGSGSGTADLSNSWLRFEQDKHSRALDSVNRFPSQTTPLKENA